MIVRIVIETESAAGEDETKPYRRTLSWDRRPNSGWVAATTGRHLGLRQKEIEFVYGIAELKHKVGL